MLMHESAVLSLAGALRRRGWRISTAESCTGGLIAGACTGVAGSSDWFERGFVTYSNEAKVEMLGVAPALLAAHGAVSAEVASAMAMGALQHAPVQLAVAVTGIAGPGGAVPGKPVGTVCFALALAIAHGPAGPGASVRSWSRLFSGDRAAVREATVAEALRALTEAAA
ncbi:MAG: CinA family protein [Rubrivivax sp.]|nr:CinA family protein [Rubrivivax sp.]